MGTALVLKNVNFSENKLDTVIFGDDVPCTGISLSQNTISFTSLSTATLTATPTPSNTTDAVVWSSSDETVATVANGIVTAVGLGSATITVYCGTESADCSVSVSVVLTETNDFARMIHRMNSGTNLSANPPKDYLGSYGEESGNDLYRAMYCSNVIPHSGYKALTGTNEMYADKYPIMIPQNAKHIEITSTILTLTAAQVTYLDSTQQPTYSISGKGCRAVTDMVSTTSVSNNKITFTIPDNVEGLDSFAFAVKYSVQTTEDPTGAVLTFTT